MALMDTIAILDFGGQYTHLIANRIRRLGVYSEILPSDVPAGKCGHFKGIILSGSPHSTLEPDRPGFDAAIFTLGIPVLGLCYGHQLMALCLNGAVVRGKYREYGIARIDIVDLGLYRDMLFDDPVIGIAAEFELRISPKVRDVLDLVTMRGEKLVELAKLCLIEMVLDEDADLTLNLSLRHTAVPLAVL